TVKKARAIVETLGDLVLSYKIGLQLLPVGGAEFGRELKAKGKNVFYDFKLHDIGATVEKATRSIATLGGDYLTVHALPDVMAAAVRGKAGSDLRVLGVTVLTSLDDQALKKMGYFMTVEELVMHRVRQAVAEGLDGVISSPLEAAKIRQIVPEDFAIITPGVRLAGDDKGDQKRIATPGQALERGASHIVVGRPITGASDMRKAVREILANIGKY
ncbi:MAG TPA: orotidine-5'-phosphate decarboxylase, partial [Hellea balneolensis]|nr:orotidine-5'-phosphate decarboxylase [Hellea balneolensis]